MDMLPDDLLIAYQTFTLLATKHKFAFAGMMTRVDPPALVALGNVTEKGEELVQLMRQYADILEDRTERGMISKPFAKNTN